VTVPHDQGGGNRQNPVTPNNTPTEPAPTDTPTP
jgi:hypothetical protein